MRAQRASGNRLTASAPVRWCADRTSTAVPLRARDQFAAAVRTDVLHGRSTLHAERALIAADLGFAVGGERCVAPFAGRSHLQTHLQHPRDVYIHLTQSSAASGRSSRRNDVDGLLNRPGAQPQCFERLTAAAVGYAGDVEGRPPRTRATDRDGCAMPASVGRRDSGCDTERLSRDLESAGARARGERRCPRRDRAGGPRHFHARRAAASRRHLKRPMKPLARPRPHNAQAKRQRVHIRVLTK